LLPNRGAREHLAALAGRGYLKSVAVRLESSGIVGRTTYGAGPIAPTTRSQRQRKSVSNHRLLTLYTVVDVILCGSPGELS
jgi:hypothetical protein